MEVQIVDVVNTINFKEYELTDDLMKNIKSSPEMSALVEAYTKDFFSVDIKTTTSQLLGCSKLINIAYAAARGTKTCSAPLAELQGDFLNLLSDSRATCKDMMTESSSCIKSFTLAMTLLKTKKAVSALKMVAKTSKVATTLANKTQELIEKTEVLYNKAIAVNVKAHQEETTTMKDWEETQASIEKLKVLKEQWEKSVATLQEDIKDAQSIESEYREEAKAEEKRALTLGIVNMVVGVFATAASVALTIETGGMLNVMGAMKNATTPTAGGATGGAAGGLGGVIGLATGATGGATTPPSTGSSSPTTSKPTTPVSKPQTTATKPTATKPEETKPTTPVTKPSATKTEDNKPTPKTEDTKPTPKTEDTKPTPKTEDTKPTPKTEDTKPTPKTDDTKPTPKTTDTKPTPKTEDTKPTPKTEDTKPTPKTEDTKPTPKTDSTTPSTGAKQETEAEARARKEKRNQAIQDGIQKGEKAINDTMNGMIDASNQKAAKASDRARKAADERRSLQTLMREQNRELTKVVSDLAGASEKSSSLKRTLAALRVVIQCLGKILVVFNSIRDFWISMNKHLSYLASISTEDSLGIWITEGNEDDEDDIQDLREAIVAIGVNWITLVRNCCLGYEELNKAQAEIEDFMKNKTSPDQISQIIDEYTRETQHMIERQTEEQNKLLAGDKKK